MLERHLIKTALALTSVVFFLNFGAAQLSPRALEKHIHTASRVGGTPWFHVEDTALLPVPQGIGRQLENLATIHLKYRGVGSGAQKCQAGNMAFKRAPVSHGDVTPELCDPLTL